MFFFLYIFLRKSFFRTMREATSTLGLTLILCPIFFQICLSRNLYHGMCCKNSSTWFNNKQVYIFTRSLELVGFYRHYIGVSIQGYYKNYLKNLYIVAWIFKKNHEEKINFKMWVIDIWLQDWVKSYLIFSHNPLSKTILQWIKVWEQKICMWYKQFW